MFYYSLVIDARPDYLPAMNQKQYFHCYTKGLESELLFEDAKEYIAGMNRIAVCWQACDLSGHGVSIFAFCLMSNHVHFVLLGSEEDCMMFMNKYKHHCCTWIRKHRGERLHEKIQIGHSPIRDREVLQKKIIYNLRQALEAGINVSPLGYPWGSGILMFNENTRLLAQAKTVSQMSKSKMDRLSCSRLQFPGDWLVLPDGLIWPGNYTRYRDAETRFASVGKFLFMLNNGNIDAEVNAEILDNLPSIPDAEVRDLAKELAMDMFGKPFISRCSQDQRLGVARRLRRELHCGDKQLARIVRLSPEAVNALI